VSSDSDFTRLAIRLRESGMKVIELKKNAILLWCKPFIYIKFFRWLPFRKSKKRTASIKKPIEKKAVEKVIGNRYQNKRKNY
jgi:hypothetical protein